jgi:hypothetical protein
MMDASPVTQPRCGFHLIRHPSDQRYRQTIFPSGCEQNSTFPVQRSSRCTPIDEETMCHLKSIANEIAMSTVATITVTGIWKLIVRICPYGRTVQNQIAPARHLFSVDRNWIEQDQWTGAVRRYGFTAT